MPPSVCCPSRLQGKVLANVTTSKKKDKRKLKLHLLVVTCLIVVLRDTFRDQLDQNITD